MRLSVQNFFILSIFVFTLNGSATSAQSLGEIKLLPPNRLTELAKTGNPDAQYWLGELIYHGAIPNWRTLQDLMIPFWESAMRQGHALATYKMHEYHSGRTLVPDDVAKLKLPEIKSYIRKLANSDEAKANMILFRDARSDFVAKQNAGEELDTLLERTKSRYLMRAYELGSRSAAYEYAGQLTFGDVSIPQDHSLAVKVYEEAYPMVPDEPRGEDFISCNVLYALSDYYSGQKYVGDEEYYSGEANDASYFHTLSRGVKNSCLGLMLNYSIYLLENGDEEDLVEAYIVAKDYLVMSENEYRLTDYIYVILGRIALKLNEPFKAKEYFSQVKDERSIEIIFGSCFGDKGFEYCLGEGFKVCQRLDIPTNDCRSYILN